VISAASVYKIEELRTFRRGKISSSVTSQVKGIYLGVLILVMLATPVTSTECYTFV
jgi:hypothetical protein